ncbi:MAG: PaaI family thioesterase, partial [Gallionellaceae bacterium]|nr:PaaI family thioesterase [Gallionellaceae bacterium]
MKETFFGLDIPFIRLLGAKEEQWEKGRAVASVEVRPELHNSWEYAHGGVVMTLLDVTMGSAARSMVPHAAGV